MPLHGRAARPDQSARGFRRAVRYALYDSTREMPPLHPAGTVDVMGYDIDSLYTPFRHQHLCRYSPDDRFVTGVFVVLDHASGALTYVNAGHNAPILANALSQSSLEPTSMALGFVPEASYDVRTTSKTVLRDLRKKIRS